MRVEKGWPKVGWAFWGAAVAAAAITLLCGLNSARWLNRPFPGFLLWENLFVPAVGSTDWTGHEAGLAYHARLVAVEGVPVTSASDAYRAAERVPVGTPLHYEFRQPQGTLLTLVIPTMRFGVPEYLLTLANYLAVGVILTLLGFIVYVLRPDAPAARAMLAAGTTWGLYLVTSADIFGPAWFRPLCLILQALGPVTLVDLALTFPVERGALRRHPWLPRGLYAVALADGIADNLAFHRSFAVLLAIDQLNSIALVVAGILLIASLADSYVRPPSAAARQRTKIAALGGVASFLIPVAGFFAYYLIGVSFPLNFVTFSIVLFPVAIGYAIVQHDLFEVDAIIRRTVAWAILTALITTVYLGGVGAIDVVFTGRGGRVVQLVFLLGIVALFNPVRDRVQAGVDTLFGREPYDYRGTVTQVSRSLARLLELDAIVARILDTITTTIRVDSGAVWLRDDSGTYRLHARTGARGDGGSSARLEHDNALIQCLEAEPQRVLIDEAPAHDGPLAATFAALHAHLVVPIAFEERSVGFIALGGKESGRFYSSEDRGLLQTLASQGAVALENAHSYRALEHTNEELRTAQTQLLHAERFAAIGEVSAAVAHGIRNPLAGIKAAARVAGIEVGPEHPVRETIGDIISESNKLEARIKALLDFAKPFEPRRTPCRIGELVDEAAQGLRTQIDAHGVALAIDLAPALPVMSVDRAQIVEVLLVLLSNAVEVMPNGGRLVMQVRLDAGGEGMRIDVRDTGPGMSAAQQTRLFHLFATTKPTGTGLGLAVAKKIVERHGGQISATSVVGEGSCFTVVLPLH